MKKYTVETTFEANQEIRKSYQWGCGKWGAAQARRWVREIRDAIAALSSFPERHPLAPESDAFSEPVRQVICGRYRLLFVIRGKAVYVVHCRGSYSGSAEDAEQ